ncbi:DUF1566 domain-containing protein [Streptomyces ziwulingensis]|uniref:Lcl C-terminal domain-containing protein n=1 Tax=Streptomyces ziwulingensis TaxID=1045501 RepID=A0ABP9CML8_9ACTN
MNEADRDEWRLVAAARRGDRDAQETLVRRLLPLVYNVVGRALTRRPDVDRVAHEAMLRAMRDLPAPGLAHGVRTEVVRGALRLAAEPPAARGGAEESPVEFDELASARTSSSRQHRELIQAGRWLDRDSRIVWSLWWLKTADEMPWADVTSVLGGSAAEAEARVRVMLGQLETGRTVVAALDVSRCDELAWCAAGWDGRPGTVWRERFAGHVRCCADCSALTLGRVAPEVLVADDVLVPVPVSLLDSVLAAVRHEGRARAVRRHRAVRAGRKGTALVAVAVAVVVAGLGVAYRAVPDDRAGSAGTGQAVGALAESSAPSSSSSASASASPSVSPSPSRTSAKPGPSGTPRKKAAEEPSEASARTAPATTRAGCGTSLAPRWADWPMPGAAGRPAQYTDLGDGTVRDEVTCLVWQRTSAPGTYTFAGARSYCARLDLNGGGWHLPSRIELMSLVDTARTGPAVDTAAFPGTPAMFFWTSSPWAVPKSPPRAWIVNFYEGLSSNAAYRSASYKARCVRGGTGEGRPAYRAAAGRITDPATGLTWQRGTASGTMTPAGADGYCAALTDGGRAWRLPTVKELATLVDDGRVTPAIDRTAFPDTPGTGAYWSSDPFAGDSSQRWFLSYNDGITSHRALAEAHVRCVS